MDHAETLNAFATELMELPKRDVVRLKKEPFKTMLPAKDPKAIDDLRGWVEPKYAYILMESIEYHLRHDASIVRCGGIFVYNVEARPDHQAWKIKEYQKKGWRVLHYANFPKLDDKIAERAARARLYSGPKGKNPWDTLAQEVEQLMHENPDVQAELKATKSENEDLKAKLAAMEQKISKSAK